MIRIRSCKLPKALGVISGRVCREKGKCKSNTVLLMSLIGNMLMPFKIIICFANNPP